MTWRRIPACHSGLKKLHGASNDNQNQGILPSSFFGWGHGLWAFLHITADKLPQIDDIAGAIGHLANKHQMEVREAGDGGVPGQYQLPADIGRFVLAYRRLRGNLIQGQGSNAASVAWAMQIDLAGIAVKTD